MLNRVPQGVRTGIKSLILRLRVQLLGGLLFIVVPPIMVNFDFVIDDSATRNNSILVVLLSYFIGFYALKKLTAYPGINTNFYIIPVFSSVYGLMIAALLFLRLDYSRSLLGMCFILTLIWVYLVQYIVSKLARPTIAICPTENTQTLTAIAGAKWEVLKQSQTLLTDLPKDCSAVIADFNAEMDDKWQRLLAQCALAGIPVVDYKYIRESMTGKVRINHISENTLGTLIPNIIYIKIKVLVDSIFALIALVFLMPVLAGTALAVKLSNPGPAIFRQRRIGYGGKSFICYKFRTMHHCDEKLEDDESQIRTNAMTRDNDTRITRLGGFLRKTRLDELPQVINIIKGEMSWIGPRPEAETLSSWYENKIPFYSYRHVVRPGISGWAQVNQGHVVDIDDVDQKLQYDFYYIKNFSLWLDIIILFRTIRTIFTGYGAK